MKKGIFSLMMGLLLAFTGLANAQNVVEIGTGTSTATVGPFLSVWGYSFNETLYPATEIGTAGTITHIAYNLQSSATYHNEVVIYMKHASITAFSGTSSVVPVTTADIVYQGSFDYPATNGWFTIELDTPFEYDGVSTLMIAFDENAPSYSSRQFYYTNVSNSIFSYYSDSANPDPYNLGAFTGNTSAGYYRSNIQLTMQTGPSTVSIVVTPNPIEMGDRPNDCWMRPMTVSITNEGGATNITGIDFDNDYFRPELGELVVPFAIAHNETVDIAVSTGTGNGDMVGVLDVDAGDHRTAFLTDIHAHAYEPVCPDVWELARVISNPSDYRDTPTTVTLYNNYVLPPANVEDGIDAVYKVTFDHDVMLNGNVTTVGGIEMAENGKMAIYTQAGIDEVGGPDLNNNYTGPQLAGPSATPYEFTLGEGTGTTGYLPLYYFYNYSLSQQLYRADELAAAGMSTLPVGSISFYSESTYGYNLTGTKIWMANVGEDAVSATSPLASGMTLVYDGAQAEVVGWNEFNLNGEFAWDGTSNILVLFLSNRGVYSSSISWQYTTMDFTAGAYLYNDGSAYNPESTAYSMSTTTNRANTKFKSVARGNRDGNVLTVCDGTTTNSYVPVYGYYADAFLKSEYIIPASQLSDMAGSNIQSMKFYSTASSANWGTTFRVFMKEVSNTTLGEFTGYADATVVYQGPLSISGSEMFVNFSTPYNYNGGNLLVGVYNETKGTYISSSWYGVEASYAGVQGYSYSSLDEITPGTASFLPKTTFTYEPAAPVPGDQLITNMTMLPGTYYIAASSTADAWDVILNASELPCPDLAYNPTPADESTDIDPSAVTLKWKLGQYTTEYRLLFGSTYYCEDILVDWTRDLAESYTVRNLFNNTNYFWRVEERNDGCPEGVQATVWGFTTTYNAPTNLHSTNANGTHIYEGETLHLAWNAIQDRTFRKYKIYQDGQLIGSTPANVNSTTYDVEGLAYNMGSGYVFNVTALYDEGESAFSNDLTIYVSGNGNVDGYVYEQDGVTGIANATVTMTGIDEFGRTQTYTFTTGPDGHYTGAMLAGQYNGMATCAGYQDVAYENNPFDIVYDELTPDINFIMHEVYYPVSEVIAEYYPDPEDPESPYVKVYWSWNIMSAMIEDFETGDFSQYDWNIPAQYPFEITTNNPYEGTYCMQSTNYNVASSTSSIDVTVEIPRDGLMSFYKRISCESSFDHAEFYMDGAQMATFTGTSGWGVKEVAVTAGTHNFKWSYTKDSSVNSGEDRFFIDYIDFIHDPEPVGPGWHTYLEGEFDNAYVSNVGTPSWGYEYPASVIANYSGMTMTKVALFSDDMYGAVGGTFTCNIYKGGATPAAGTLVSTITVNVPANVGDWVEFDLTNPVSVSGDPLYVLWTADVIGGLGYPAGCATHTSAYGDWWNPGDGSGWTHMGDCTWTMKNYFAGRNGRGFWAAASDDANQAIQPVSNLDSNLRTYVKGEEANNGAACINPNATFKATTASADRSFQFFRVYRTDCYNDGPYTLDNTVVCCSELVDSIYIDVEWPELPSGIYKWGVSCVYGGNRGELIESPITWAGISVKENGFEPATAEGMEDMTGFRTAPAQVHAGMNSRLFRGSVGYVDNTYGSIIPSGLCKLDMDNPQGATSLNAGTSLYAGEIVDGIIYGYDSSGNYLTYDAETGAQLSSVYVGTAIREMAYDHTTSTMYGSSTSENTLYRIDLATGAYTAVGTMSGITAVAGLVCDATGQLYAMAFTTGDLYKVDKATAALTLVGNTGRTPAYVQSAAIDYATGTCYWAYSDASYDDLYIVDLSSAAATFVCSFVESCGLCFPLASGPTPTPDPQTDPIQEPWESPIVWSNCLDKDMYLESAVDITVLLNSADNPEGINVKFTNLNAGEQELYPIEPVVLDETGFYAWETFRRGDYLLEITNGAAYEPITDTVSIWDATSLRYVMIEIIYGVSDLYVSHTGWAMWEGQGPGPVPPGPGDEFFEDFEGGLGIFSSLDQDGDGYGWRPNTELSGLTGGHNSTNFVLSQSFDNSYGVLYPDNYLVSPQVGLTNGSTFSFWACAQDESWAAEHFGVFVSDNGTSDWTSVQEWTLTAKGARLGGERGLRQGSWHQYSVDLSAYAGQKYIAVRHFNTSDMFYIDLDDAELTIGAKSGDDRHLEGYKVLCTSIDGEPIFSGNTEHPFIQLPTETLVPGENYICKVAAIYSTGISDWTVAEWQYIPCYNYEGAISVEGETGSDGNTVTWEYPSGPVPPPPGPGDEFTVDFEGGLPADWNVIDGNNDGLTWCLTSAIPTTWTYYASLTLDWYRNGTNAICSGSYVNGFGAANPDEYLVSPQVTLTNGSTFSFWAAATDASYPADHFGVFVSDNGTSDWTMVNEWTLTAKGNYKAGDRASRDGEGLRLGNWYNYSVDLSAFAGQKYIAIRHFNCYDQYIMCVDDIELSIGAKSSRDVVAFNGFVTDPGAMANGADASWIKGTQSTWGPNANNGGGYWLADSFTLNATTTISEIEVYGYQTGSTTTSTFTGLYAQIYDGNPMNGANVVWGTTADNIMTATAFTNCYRGSDGETTATTRPIMSITASNLSIQLEAGTYYLAYSLAGTGSSGPWGAPHAEPGIGNTGAGFQNTGSWTALTDSGDGSSYGCAMKITGSGDGPTPGPTGDIIGAMIFRDGEWLAEVTYPVSEYVDEDEYGTHEYCVRLIYNGTNVLPDHNEYYSMSCPECVIINGDLVCEPGAPINGEYVWNSANNYGALISWGGAPVPPGPGDEFTEGFENGTLGIFTQIDADGDGFTWQNCSAMLGAGYGHNGSQYCALSQSYDNTYGVLYPDNYLVSPQVMLTNGSTFSFWACAQDSGYPSEHFGVAVSTTGTAGSFEMVDEWTLTAKGGRPAGARGTRDQGAWHQYSVDLSAYAGQQMYIAIRHFNCQDWFYIDLDDVELSIGAKARAAELVKYNVYRSTDNVNYELIGSVDAVEGATYYEYFDDEVPAGMYYYQVRAYYSNGCESEPAASEANPANNYVIVVVTSVAENGEIALYPNPTNGNITIQAQNMNRITVVSVLGQVVYDLEVEGDQQIINMAQFNAGVYMVRIATENGVSTQRVTVVK